MSFAGWLDARDSATVEREWATLGATKIQIGQWTAPLRQIRPEGAALLAAGILGCSPDRFAWWATESYANPSTWPAPTFEVGRVVSRSFLDHEFDLSQPDCSETWRIREVIEGSRGVQHITIDCSWGPMTREGGEGRGATVVRVFDRSTSRAVSIPLHSTVVWVVGEVDLSPLDLFAQRMTFKLPWQTYDTDALRGLFAQLAADLDAHFDTCTTWPGGVTHDEVIEVDDRHSVRIRRRTHRFEAPPYAIELDELLDPDANDRSSWLTAKVEGLPWGHRVSGRIDRADDPVFGVDGWIDLTLPRAQLDATLIRLAAVPGIQIG